MRTFHNVAEALRAIEVCRALLGHAAVLTEEDLQAVEGVAQEGRELASADAYHPHEVAERAVLAEYYRRLWRRYLAAWAPDLPAPTLPEVAITSDLGEGVLVRHVTCTGQTMLVLRSGRSSTGAPCWHLEMERSESAPRLDPADGVRAAIAAITAWGPATAASSYSPAPEADPRPAAEAAISTHAANSDPIWALGGWRPDSDYWRPVPEPAPEPAARPVRRRHPDAPRWGVIADNEPLAEWERELAEGPLS